MPNSTPDVVPELHFLAPTPHVPNSPFPIIVYRNVLQDTSPEGIIKAIEPNDWIEGGQWTTYKVAHFHSNTHECYAVIKGNSTYSLGKSPVDPDFDEDGKENGMKLEVGKGDVFILPAGVSHCSLESEGDYEFVGLYPKGFPKWNMNMCEDSPNETAEKEAECRSVPIPDHDPVHGLSGSLPRLWRETSK